MPIQHTCHWPGCKAAVPPKMWGCKGHWFRLPKRLRDRIWATYRPGQEITKTPSAAYIDAAKAVQSWIAEQSSAGDELPPCIGEAMRDTITDIYRRASGVED